jgi:hypothetical protein
MGVKATRRKTKKCEIRPCRNLILFKYITVAYRREIFKCNDLELAWEVGVGLLFLCFILHKLI